jgi:DNA modification methylase
MSKGQARTNTVGKAGTARRDADHRSNLTGAPPTPAWATGTGTANMAPGTSIFDPVLCELVYRWFCPPGGLVLDPFAGGSVRGIVAAKLGRRYIGVDLRAEQIAANVQQWRGLDQRSFVAARPADCLPDLTPVERVGDIAVKRDDLFAVAGVRGGKVRTCWALAQGATGLVTAGSRASPQVNIVAHIAARLGLPCRVHCPTGELSPEVAAAQAVGAEVIQHKAGYNNVIIARAREDAQARGWTEIPFGMECAEAIAQTRRQVRNLPPDATRIVVAVGSGMSLAGILRGLADPALSPYGDAPPPVLGVVVGADPTKRLDEYAPPRWRDMVRLVPSGSDYHDAAAETRLGSIDVDPYYEAKALAHLRAGDVFWTVGIRQTAVSTASPDPQWIVGDALNVAALAEGVAADLVFSCPPYADLERYSDDPLDLSTLDYPAFRDKYRAIVAACVGLLKPDRFACFVVGDVRDRKGFYRRFVSDTEQAFEDAGARLYNEAILVTATGSLPVRVGRQFEAGRKLGKTHQNVLVFCKGDPKRATAAIGPVEFGALEEDAAGSVDEGADAA